jgi:hypothetical protein
LFLSGPVQQLVEVAKHDEGGISGEPMFDSTCRYAGYRGVGTQVVPDGLTG